MGSAQTYRIVVADDAPTYRRYLANFLRQRNYTVLEAKNGLDAIELIRRELPDLAILDLWMPGMSGVEATRSLTENPATATIPIILLSGDLDEKAAETALASGAKSYFTKPFDVHELGLRVADLLYREDSTSQADGW